MDILKHLDQLGDLQRERRINPMLTNSVIKHFHEGDYDACLKAVINYLQQSNTLDVYILFISFAADVYINTDALEQIADKLRLYLALLKKHTEHLSPIDQFEATAKNGFDAFCQIMEAKIDEKIKKTAVFDVDALIQEVDAFMNYTATIGKFDLQQQKSAMRLKQLLTKLKRFVDQLVAGKTTKTDETEATENTSKDKKHNENPAQEYTRKYVDEFASVAWYKLVKKVAILKSLMHQKRLFEAAIVYQDLQSELTQFDPKKYFPGLFFPIYKTLATNAREIYEHIAMHSNSLQWHIAKQMYATDDMRFLKDLPSMAENTYTDEQFLENGMPVDEEHQTTGLLDDQANFPDSEHIKLKEFDEVGIDALAVDDTQELSDLMDDIESISSQSELSKKATK